MLLESSRGLLITKPSAQTIKTLAAGRVAWRPCPAYTTFACRASMGVQPGLQIRSFSSSRPILIKEFFPKPEASGLIRKTAATWEHPMYVSDAFREGLIRV
jgi:hypothetical protein